jgi:SHS2 domain-containing protein
MSYRYLDDLGSADIAFEALGSSLAELFVAAADATVNAMVEDISLILPSVTLPVMLTNSSLDLLLFDLLQELIFYKDAKQLMFRLTSVDVKVSDGQYGISAVAKGEKIDPARHSPRLDVKAVTLHRFVVERLQDGQWRAQVILDV